MSKDFLYLRHWITGEGYPEGDQPRPVILECIPSRSALSMGVYDRSERIFSVPAPAFGGGAYKALGRFLESCFVPELSAIHPTWEPYEKERGYDSEVEAGIFRHYEGGLSAFILAWAN